MAKFDCIDCKIKQTEVTDNRYLMCSLPCRVVGKNSTPNMKDDQNKASFSELQPKPEALSLKNRNDQARTQQTPKGHHECSYIIDDDKEKKVAAWKRTNSFFYENETSNLAYANDTCSGLEHYHKESDGKSVESFQISDAEGSNTIFAHTNAILRSQPSSNCHTQGTDEQQGVIPATASKVALSPSHSGATVNTEQAELAKEPDLTKLTSKEKKKLKKKTRKERKRAITVMNTTTAKKEARKSKHNTSTSQTKVMAQLELPEPVPVPVASKVAWKYAAGRRTTKAVETMGKQGLEHDSQRAYLNASSYLVRHDATEELGSGGAVEVHFGMRGSKYTSRRVLPRYAIE